MLQDRLETYPVHKSPQTRLHSPVTLLKFNTKNMHTYNFIGLSLLTKP